MLTTFPYFKPNMDKKLEAVLARYAPDEQVIIREAFEFSKAAHEGQFRKSGEPYIAHPVEVAAILSELKLDVATIIAALLHDVPEDTEVTLEEIERKFGEEVAYLVNGVTKLTKVRLRGSHEPEYVENLRKMFIAAAQDLRVVMIKLADRLHNMRTLDALPPEKAANIAMETLEIFAPLANRLGIGEIKGELEDRAFRYVYPEEHQALMDSMTTAYNERKRDTEKSIKAIMKILAASGIRIIDIHGRAKHLYSLHGKLKRYETSDPNQMPDLMAVRIIVPTTADCYATLGLIHEHYRPLPGKIKDYISIPKPNGYQSLHTTIFGPTGKVLEIQIRTPAMHEYAEHGIAAHWTYAESGKPKSELFEPGKKFAWVKQLREIQKEIDSDPKEFLELLKLDFFQNRIFCFTPEGDVIDLPVGSTPIDFAFAVHSDLGYRCQGAKTNGKMIKLTDELHNGDVVEILTSKRHIKVPQDWLQHIKTSRARERIKKALKE